MRDGRLVGGILMGDISKAAYLMQAFDRDTPLPEERLSLLFDLGAPTQKVTLDEMPADDAGLQLQRREQGGDRRLRRGRQAHRQGGDGRDPRRHGLRLVQERWSREVVAMVLRRRGRGGSVGALLRAGRAAGQAAN